MLTGRAKDTIVLSNGENVEPQPIEDACQVTTELGSLFRGLGRLGFGP